MAFPTVSHDDFTEFFASATTSHVITLATPINAGQLILLKVFITGSSVITASGYTEIGTQVNTDRFATLAKVATGSEGGTTVDVVTGSAAFAIVHEYVIDDWFGSLAGVEIAFATGTSATPDPPDLTPSWGAEDTLWLPGVGKSTGTITGAPTNYTNLINGAGGDNMGSARRELNATSENPGTFAGSTSTTWIAETTAIRQVVVSPSGFRLLESGTDFRVLEDGVTFRILEGADPPSGVVVPVFSYYLRQQRRRQ